MNELDLLAKNETVKNATHTFDGTVIGAGSVAGRVTVKTQTGTVIRNVPAPAGAVIGSGVVVGNNTPGGNKFSIFSNSYKSAQAVIIKEV
jgi:hypothetical protein